MLYWWNKATKNQIKSLKTLFKDLWKCLCSTGEANLQKIKDGRNLKILWNLKVGSKSNWRVCWLNPSWLLTKICFLYFFVNCVTEPCRSWNKRSHWLARSSWRIRFLFSNWTRYSYFCNNSPNHPTLACQITSPFNTKLGCFIFLEKDYHSKNNLSSKLIKSTLAECLLSSKAASILLLYT